MKTCPACKHQNLADALICESCGDHLEIGSGWEKTTIRGTHLEAFAPGYLVAERYEIVKEIGRGGMGVVYRVRDTRLQGREEALKMIHPQLVELPEAQQRFEQEVNTCLDLLHPSIVRVHNLQEWQGLQFFTMEYITGRSLQELIAERKSKKPPFTLSEAVSIISPLLDALAYAHQYTIHRDIKPDNIIVIGDFPDVNVKVLDFGIAKTLSVSRFTQTAQVLGTAYYMAPEQMSGTQIDHRADLYSVGMILNEMLTGEMAVGRFRLPGEIYSEFPKELDEMLEKALAPTPEQRFPDATAMQQALQRVVSITETDIKEKPIVETAEAAKLAVRGPRQIQEETIAAKPVLAGGSRKLLPWIFASAVVLIVFLAAGVFFLGRDKQDSVATAPTTQKEQVQPKTVSDKGTDSTKTIEPVVITQPPTQQPQLLKNPPEVTSETYIFYPNEKRMNNMKILAVTSWGGEAADLIKGFEEKGIKIAKMPTTVAPRALEVAMVDGVLTTSKDLIAELKEKHPEGVVIRQHPETAKKEQAQPKTAVGKEKTVREPTPSESVKPQEVEAVSLKEKDWSNDWSVVQKLAGLTLNNGAYRTCPASYDGSRTADTIAGPIIIHISDQVKRPDWIGTGKFAEYSGSTNWRWNVKETQKSNVKVVSVLGGGFPDGISKSEQKSSFAVTLGLEPHYPKMQSIDGWFVFPYIIRAYHLQLIENLTENFVKQKVDTPLGSIECYKLQYPGRAPDTGELRMLKAKDGAKKVLGTFNFKEQGPEIDDGKHTARSVSRYLGLQMVRSSKVVIMLWYDVNTGILVKGVTHKAGKESLSFVLKDTNIKGLALR